MAIESTDPMQTQTAPLRRSFWQRRVDALFGYDFFILYSLGRWQDLCS